MEQLVCVFPLPVITRQSKKLGCRRSIENAALFCLENLSYPLLETSLLRDT
jgi:hypothetical protein